MGLAERKVKQRIGYDPRNLSWSEDKDRFSFKHMTNLGWKENSGIGRDLQGNANHIAVVRKIDNGGIGMGRLRKEGQDVSAGAGQAGAGLEDVLKRLAARASASASASPSISAQPSPSASPAPSPGPSGAAAVRNKIASRQRHLHSKRMASQDPAALAAILGVPVSSLPSTPAESAPTSGASTPATEATPEPTTEAESEPAEGERNALETITTSTMSVADYFRQKLREKMLARQAASGSATPTLSEGSLAAIPDEKKVDIGGVAWEGSKMQFDEAATAVVDLGGDEPPVAVTTVVVQETVTPAESAEGSEKSKSKKDKKDRKEKKDKKDKKDRKGKQKDTEASATPAEPTSDAIESPTPALSDKDAKRKEKVEKRRRKEEKRARKEAEGKESSESKDKSKDKKKRKRDDSDDGEGKKRRSK